jgi:PmbA protein
MKDIALYALESLKKAGADKAAVSASQGRADEFNIEANKFSLLRTMFNNSISLKALVGGRKGTASVNKLDKPSVDEAVANCITLANSAQPDEAEDIAPLSENKHFDQTAGGADLAKLFSRSKEYLEQVKDEFPAIMIEGFSSTFGGGEYAYVNSNGVIFTGNRENYGFNSTFIAKEGEKTSSFNYTGGSMLDLNKSFMDFPMHRSQLEDSVKSLNTRMFEGTHKGRVIITPSCPDLWYTIIGLFLSDSSLIEGTSLWKDKLGEHVADKILTMRSIPTNSMIVNGERFTGDGFLSEDYDIISEGVLKSFVLGLYGANKTGKPRAKNSSPYTMEVKPGNTALADMIASIDKGILVNRFSGGAPGPGGDISGVAKNSFLIENGKVTDAIQETMVSFNLQDALNNIVSISKEVIQDGGSILPWTCFDGITISGK